MRTCETCGEQFEPLRPRQRHCRPSCVERAGERALPLFAVEEPPAWHRELDRLATRLGIERAAVTPCVAGDPMRESFR
jgi:hypothetical protein